MIMLYLFTKQLLIGAAIAAIDGPATILCMQKTLKLGFKQGILVGLGSAVAYSIYGVVGEFGVAKNIITWVGEAFMDGVGGVFLFWFGIMTIKSFPLIVKKKYRSDEPLIYSFISAFFFTLANPVSILLFIIFYAGIEVHTLEINNLFAFALSGVFLGSSLWWLALSGTIEKIRNHLSGKTLSNINRCTGVVLIMLGCYAFFRSFQSFIS